MESGAGVQMPSLMMFISPAFRPECRLGEDGPLANAQCRNREARWRKWRWTFFFGSAIWSASPCENKSQEEPPRG
jgi:hypothetical protein